MGVKVINKDLHSVLHVLNKEAITTKCEQQNFPNLQLWLDIMTEIHVIEILTHIVRVFVALELKRGEMAILSLVELKMMTAEQKK